MQDNPIALGEKIVANVINTPAPAAYTELIIDTQRQETQKCDFAMPTLNVSISLFLSLSLSLNSTQLTKPQRAIAPHFTTRFYPSPV